MPSANQPCGKCVKARTECIRGTGEKQRPVSKNYVQALEAQVATLELFIQKLATSTAEQRDELLLSYVVSHPTSRVSLSTSPVPAKLHTPSLVDHDVVLARPRAGHLRKLRSGSASQFYGGTSLFQLHVSHEASAALRLAQDGGSIGEKKQIQLSNTGLGLQDVVIQYSPCDRMSRRMIASFFHRIYPYNMVVYREYFLRDYDAGLGRYYSDILLYAVCALGALVSDDPRAASISQVYASQAQALILKQLDAPDLCMLQALLLLGSWEAGHNNASKGWLFCGMAFRLVHEMGLHLDPNNWGESLEKSADNEILRRVYWGAFIVDKQLSLYFGRTPALYPQESDVCDTTIITRPAELRALLETYVVENASTCDSEDDAFLVVFFTYQAKLAKITHTIIADIFENRRSNIDSAVVAAKARQAHSSLIKWLSDLPGKLHWNQWTVGQTPHQVLHLHMTFHTLMIILHRPPQQLLSRPGMGSGEDVKICYQSLQVLLRLMRSYNRYYDYRCLPLDFVHTLSTAAGVVLMKRILQNLPWDDAEISRNLGFLLNVMDSVSTIWPCVTKIREILLLARSSSRDSSGTSSLGGEFAFNSLMGGFPTGTEGETETLDSSTVSETPAMDDIITNNIGVPKGYAMFPGLLKAKDMPSLTQPSSRHGDGDFRAFVADDAIGSNFEWELFQDTPTWFVESLPSGY
ncbi:hypothetical protein Cpir12675_006835 [Ceratocystis pirilliformis]|uniref:Xylanolytic transcriptional activator regulatory domain-containing protein n=1 Tax=Ceratocystis pirilliformis TaxID=259994 RepID=A0ABR3YHM9_9PEZI